MTACKCPVCDGSGQYHPAHANRCRTCHGCQGRGWVCPEMANTDHKRPTKHDERMIPNPLAPSMEPPTRPWYFSDGPLPITCDPLPPFHLRGGQCLVLHDCHGLNLSPPASQEDISDLLWPDGVAPQKP